MDTKGGEVSSKQKEMQEARERMKEKFSGARTGGEGTARRKFKTTHKTAMNDSKLDGIMKKFNTQPVPQISEVNMFTKDGKVITFNKPQGNRIADRSASIVPDTGHDRIR